jgi:hypothetical protein
VAGHEGQADPGGDDAPSKTEDSSGAGNGDSLGVRTAASSMAQTPVRNSMLRPSAVSMAAPLVAFSTANSVVSPAAVASRP